MPARVAVVDADDDAGRIDVEVERSIEFIRTDNRKVLTYVRRYGKDIVLCVANLSRTVQPVVVPLAPALHKP